MRARTVVVVSVLIATVAMASPSLAQKMEWNGAELDAWDVPAEMPAANEVASGVTPTDPSPAEPAWGTQDWTTVTVGIGDYIRRWGCSSNGVPDIENMDVLMPATGQTAICVGFPAHLPTGAHVEYVRVMYYDDTASSVPSMGLFSLSYSGPRSPLVSLTPSAWSSGNRYVDFESDFTVLNKNQSYSVLAILNRNGATYEGLYNITFWFHLQVSPAPATATFNDVPVGAFAFQHIEALAASGITAGCGSNNFCPNEYLTRAQMAVFLAKALGLHWDG